MSAADNDADTADTVRAFKQAVNMTPKQLAAWLETPESKEVGYKSSEGSESVGHHSGRRIVTLLDKAQADFSDGDLAHAKKVLGYIHRHLAQRPSGDILETRWRYSLMNWGHDPLKGGK
ncbi:MAG: DUF3140 domain-containing protein [Polaromonas sp.]|nr:DUF3140 domain-containing protein [Polaromonas sp.]